MEHTLRHAFEQNMSIRPVGHSSALAATYSNNIPFQRPPSISFTNTPGTPTTRTFSSVVSISIPHCRSFDFRFTRTERMFTENSISKVVGWIDRCRDLKIVSRRYRSSAACWSTRATIEAVDIGILIRINFRSIWLIIVALRRSIAVSFIVDSEEIDARRGIETSVELKTGFFH